MAPKLLIRKEKIKKSLQLITLFVDGCPIVYEMEKKSQAFHFTPISNWNDGVEASGFRLQKNNDNWIVNVEISRDVIDQAIEEIEQSYN